MFPPQDTLPMKPYEVGRFAPSPSGPLHFGSLIAALGSFLIAKYCGAKWLLRIEDIDPPREVEGASDTILRQLETFALHWDDEVIYQSQHIDKYEEILEDLHKRQLIYGCNCTRKQIIEFSQKQSIKHGLYPNICADKNLDLYGKDGAVAWKLKHGNQDYDFDDLIQGQCQFAPDLYREDFTVKRKDGLMAYQLAVVADDIAQGVDHVVRGCDLLDSTPRQLRLYQVLGQPAPDYFHLPLAINHGNKLSKQNHAPAIAQTDSAIAAQQLVEALQFLGQAPEPELASYSCQHIIAWALENFDPYNIPKKQQISIDK